MALSRVNWAKRPAVELHTVKHQLKTCGLYALSSPFKRHTPTKDVYVIGDVPAETLHVRTSWENFGGVMIINDGVLLVDSGATAIIHGNVQMQGHGKLFVDGGMLVFPQSFTYEWGLVAYDSSTWEMHNAELSFGGYSFTSGAAMKANIVFDTVSITSGWLTAGLYWGASADLYHVHHAGEWIFADSCQAHFTDVDTMLSWFSFTKGDSADIQFPAWDSLQNFVVQNGSNGITGIDYSITFDTIDYAMWGMLVDTGSVVTVRNSTIRSIGILGYSSDSQYVSGLVDGSDYTDFTLSMTDRYFRLLNTHVNTWSLYPGDTFFLSFKSCIVGEVLSMGSAIAWGENYFLDGSGGHFQASENSLNVAFYSDLCSEIYTTENGLAFLVLVAVPYGDIWARDNSRLYLIQSQFPQLPRAYDSGLVYLMGIDAPTSAGVEESVPVIGSAMIINGPYASIHFSNYNLYWASVGDTSVWNPIAINVTSQFWRDTLGMWDTHGLQTGDYLLKLVLWDSSPDSLDEEMNVRLEESGINELNKYSGVRMTTQLDGIIVNITRPVKIRLKVYDVSGRFVSTLFDGVLRRTTSKFYFEHLHGLYFVKLEGEHNEILKVLKIKN